jgi:hypothetical protein
MRSLVYYYHSRSNRLIYYKLYTSLVFVLIIIIILSIRGNKLNIRWCSTNTRRRIGTQFDVIQ